MAVLKEWCPLCLGRHGKHFGNCPNDGHYPPVEVTVTEVTPPTPLALRVDLDLRKILAKAPSDWRGHAELPDGDLSAYDVAYDKAIRTCPHKHLVEIMYRRQWQCAFCRRYFDQTTRWN